MPGITLSLSVALALSAVLPAPALAQESSPAARAALARSLYDTAIGALASGTGSPSEAYEWSVRWMRADLEAHVPNAAQLHFERMTTLAARVHAQVAAGTLRGSAETECQYYAAEARAWLARPPTVP